MSPVSPAAERLAAWEARRARFQGLGILEPLLERPGVTDIYVNGPREIWTDGAQGMQRTGLCFPDDAAVRDLATRIIASEGQRLDASRPCADVQTPDGYRFHAVLPPVAARQTHLSIRLQPALRPDFSALQKAGMFSEETGELIRSLVRRKRSLLISGGTGTGKTTLLNAVLGLCPPTERLVLIEDSPELEPDHPHVVSLRSRYANAEGAGEVTLTSLIRQALRMGPDRLILGECRGAEVKDFLLAMNTGHEGGGVTLHANSAASVPSRLLALGALAGLGHDAVAHQAANAVDVVVHVRRSGVHRWVSQMGLLSLEGNDLVVVLAVEFGVDGDATCARAWSTLAALAGLDGSRPTSWQSSPQGSGPLTGGVRP
jgi:pilus assembly protein CpaF